MNIMKKFHEKATDNTHKSAVAIAFLGDSVTQGCFELYKNEANEIETIFDKESAYPNYLYRIFSMLYPSVPVHIINAGISGDVAPNGFNRLERDVLCYNPDLVVVCYGLNDVCGGMENIETYQDALRSIFSELQRRDKEVIFMTPNMMNTKVSAHLTDTDICNHAHFTKELQNSGVMDAYYEAAVDVCWECKIPICDCYAKWKLLAMNGVDTTELLANKLNHPTREMNWMFAMSLVEIMLQCESGIEEENNEGI